VAVQGVEAIATEIDRRLEAVRPAGSPNAITAADLREWAAEYLRHHDDMAARYPNLAGCPHWNLWMRNEPDGDGLFAVLAFWPHGMDFYCGTGDALEVRSVSENALNDDPTAVYEALRARFHVPGELLRLDCRAAEAWLGRPRAW
jgi:hypothetical protein